MAESATVDFGGQHEVTLICELLEGHRTTRGSIRKWFRRKNFKRPVVEPLFANAPEVLASDKCQVDHGMLYGVPWRRLVQEACRKLPRNHPAASVNVDPECAVVTADTRRRILRYVFPRHQAVALEIDHPDKPGVLKRILKIVKRSRLNILSALLRRGGAVEGRAILVVLCETERQVSTEQIRAEVAERLVSLEGVFAVLNPEKKRRSLHTHARHPSDVSVPIPEHLADRIRQVKENHSGSSRRVFVSRRFSDMDDRRQRIVKALEDAISARGYQMIEVDRTRKADASVAEEVLASMWAANCGIVLVSDPGEDNEAFSHNLAHEFGVLQALGKSPAFLVEKGQVPVVHEIANLRGLKNMVFASGEPAFDEARVDSIPRLVGEYFDEVEREWRVPRD